MTLYEKLIAAGLPIESATEDGAVSVLPGIVLTDEQSQLMSDICFEHLRPVEYAVTVSIRNRLNAAKPFAKSIPNWATWTQEQLQTWWNNNLADAIVDGFSIPAGVKAMLKAQNAAILREGQMLIALRDAVFPDLPE